MESEEGMLFDPFNSGNKEITLNDVQCILSQYGVHAPVNNIDLYKRAFVHRSYTKRPEAENEANNIKIVPKPANCLPLKTKSNERLEFVGDGVLELITKYYLYRRFPKAEEGFMTEKKIALVKNEHIGRLAYEMRLHKWIIISRHAEEKKTRTNLKKLGCLFEAFLGALFLDFNKIEVKDENGWFENVFVCGPGFQMAQIFVESVFEKHVDFVKLVETDDNYKNILQVIIQKEFKTTPEYVELSFDPEFGYHMGVYLCMGITIHQAELCTAVPFAAISTFEKIHSEFSEKKQLLVFLGGATHKIKKKAEQLACALILENL
jgi:dsRNA-specific ribonuclease